MLRNVPEQRKSLHVMVDFPQVIRKQWAFVVVGMNIRYVAYTRLCWMVTQIRIRMLFCLYICQYWEVLVLVFVTNRFGSWQRREEPKGCLNRYCCVKTCRWNLAAYFQLAAQLNCSIILSWDGMWWRSWRHRFFVIRKVSACVGCHASRTYTIIIFFLRRLYLFLSLCHKRQGFCS
jgi:hypothetical protein